MYQDVWHKDILLHLDLRLNNGDERLRAHDIFPAVSIPDVFMEAVEKRGEWHLFDPHEVKEVMGYSLEDYYDEERGSGTFRDKYAECVAEPKLSRTTIPAIDVMKRILRSQLETGTPFMFYRDEINRMNANSHEGIIYSSNLCTEITQNQSPTVEVKREMTEDGVIITYRQSGDFVVCNLSSVNLGKAHTEEVLEKLIPIQVRMLDNVIDINNLPVYQAKFTNQRYRAVGLGTFGWHHLLALKGIEWEDERSVKLADELYELIAYLTIKASADLAKEKGSYNLFEGSDWSTGAYFKKRGYLDGNSALDWESLAEEVKATGIRNGYLMAVAPNASTSIIAGSTAGIDPIFKVFYQEEKKDAKYPVAAPDLDHNTYNVYRRTAYQIDQRISVEQTIARQRHVDQAISFNFYVPNTIKASMLLGLHMQLWEGGGKTSYYVRSTATEVSDCEWCES